MQIIILGMHRSGTSLTTRIVNMMGAYFGPEGSIGGINKDNPKGFWERPEIFKLNDALLASKGCTWNDLQQWTFKNAGVVPDTIERTIRRMVLGMDAFRPWVMKDPRLCLLLPAWLPYLEVPIAVIVHRNPMEIAISLKNRDNFPIAYSMALWEYYMVGMLNATRHLPRIFVRHSDLLSAPFQTSEKLYNQLAAAGVRRLALPTAKEIQAFIDPKLYRSKPTPKIGYKLNPAQKELVEILRGERSRKEVVRVTKQAHTLIKAGMPAHA